MVYFLFLFNLFTVIMNLRMLMYFPWKWKQFKISYRGKMHRAHTEHVHSMFHVLGKCLQRVAVVWLLFSSPFASNARQIDSSLNE